MSPAEDGGSRVARARVAFGWMQVEALERIGPRAGTILTAPTRRLAARSAERKVEPLVRWERVSEASYATYTRDPNITRIKRVLELVEPGERILDIGFGFGYVAGVLLRSGLPSYYCGTDIKRLFLDSAESMIDANGLEETPHCFEVLNVYDLDAAFVARHEPSLVLLLEVLEHVEDPTRALRCVADAVPSGTRVIFTVPLFGRLERVWGHHSLFDAARIQDMCAGAGLAVEHVEPVQNVWCMILARSLEGQRRNGKPAPSWLRALSERSHRRKALPAYTFSQMSTLLPEDQYRRSGDTVPTKVEPSLVGVRCTASVRSDAAGPGVAGIRLPIPRARIVRVELSMKPPRGATAVYVTGHDAEGRERLRWRWEEEGERPLLKRMTHVLRPGERSHRFVAERQGDPDAVEWLEFWAEVPPGGRIEMMLHRAAYIGGPPDAH